MHKRKLDPDPYYQDTPWEIIHDERGKVIGEVFTLPARMTTHKKYGGAGMANRNMLHKSRLEQFKTWLQATGWELHPTKGPDEVIRARKDGFLMLIHGNSRTQHLSFGEAHTSVVKQFIREYKRAEKEASSQ
ncbi:hypothetical protein SAMN04487969_102457 [Paenibacillus algorifonticola]|uniref:Uncharacterized protein n=1 Tax=Paenibacillus algorifonticola TaxID=684063 RepID=A0A1I2AFP0_9BACL|nr:hypothetical protein [Paenibacillus algorifonticola]SFE42527.1 hypothetical protein SAMN04487969_102457 [Paenibacillus algorifonticola]